MKLLAQIHAVMALALLLTSASSASQKQPALASAPLPSQLSSARIIFLSNSCEDDNKTCRDIYNQLYAGLKSNGHFRLLTTPHGSDLVLEIHYVLEPGMDWRAVRLIARDPEDRAILWTITEDSHHSSPTAAVQQALTDFFAITNHS